MFFSSDRYRSSLGSDRDANAFNFYIDNPSVNIIQYNTQGWAYIWITEVWFNIGEGDVKKKNLKSIFNVYIRWAKILLVVCRLTALLTQLAVISTR